VSKTKVSRLVPSGLALAVALASSVVEAAPKGGVGGPCKDKAFSEIDDEDDCEACGGKWTVDENDCGGLIVAGGLELIGALAVGSGIGAGVGIALGLASLAAAAVNCEGTCEAKAG
jgi:hypothetical protein